MGKELTPDQQEYAMLRSADREFADRSSRVTGAFQAIGNLFKRELGISGTNEFDINQQQRERMRQLSERIIQSGDHLPGLDD